MRGKVLFFLFFIVPTYGHGFDYAGNFEAQEMPGSALESFQQTESELISETNQEAEQSSGYSPDGIENAIPREIKADRNYSKKIYMAGSILLGVSITTFAFWSCFKNKNEVLFEAYAKGPDLLVRIKNQLKNNVKYRNSNWQGYFTGKKYDGENVEEIFLRSQTGKVLRHNANNIFVPIDNLPNGVKKVSVDVIFPEKNATGKLQAASVVPFGSTISNLIDSGTGLSLAVIAGNWLYNKYFRDDTEPTDQRIY